MIRRFLPAVALVLTTPAAAQTGLTFTGTVLDSCTVIAGTPGVLGTANGNTLLSSEVVGGIPSLATVAATGLGYELSVEAPTAFDLAPAGAATGTTFSASFETSGATLVGRIVAGLTASVALGTTFLTVDAEAARPGDVFPAGAYAMTATVRCARP
ncbi:hypothetical protein [Parvularcula dongshanensis]|uniref:Spore coat protein U domain-containing protein n=1 Tax=Parvularcula dongshanensis TaxID=1173995 RepID=A0A840I0Y8_9PROT|nr:hypothetical protein [Parvularcula dongshanensis]MBB4657941.1 hypothetical protein [Parvularcula dongshanensis]